eukprot:2897451-Pyramimonas_sp.AAC.1
MIFPRGYVVMGVCASEEIPYIFRYLSMRWAPVLRVWGVCPSARHCLRRTPIVLHEGRGSKTAGGS